MAQLDSRQQVTNPCEIRSDIDVKSEECEIKTRKYRACELQSLSARTESGPKLLGGVLERTVCLQMADPCAITREIRYEIVKNEKCANNCMWN